MKTACLFALITLGLSSAHLYSSEASGTNPVNDTATVQEQVDVFAAAKLVNLHYQNRRKVLTDQLQDGDDAAQITAIEQLSALQEPQLIQVIAPYLDFNLHSDAVVKAACRGMARLQARQQIKTLTDITQHPNSSEAVKKAAWNALGQLKALSKVNFTDESDNPAMAVRASGVTNLGIDRVTDAGPILAQAVLNDSRAHVRRMAAIGLGKLGDPNFAETLCIALTDGDVQVRRFAANALVKLDYKPAIPYLLIQLESNVGGQFLNQALVRLSGQDFGYDYTDTLTARRDAIAKGFTWYTSNSK